MNKSVTLGSVFLAAGLLFSGTAPGFTESFSVDRFYKGNLHTHTLESDGDAPVDEVLRWYKSAGYNFVSITDHDKLTPTAGKYAPSPGFVTLAGVEITGLAQSKKPIHVNALCGKSPLKGIRRAAPVTEVLAENIGLSRADGAITLVNHPNFGWAITEDELATLDGFEMLEIASGHPLVNELGDATRPSHEQIWDTYLSRKGQVFGTAVDDAHDYYKFAKAERNPGRAWIQVWAPELTEEAICAAIREGRFYSSKGARISAIRVEDRFLEVSVDDWNSVTDHVAFLGQHGQVLSRTTASPARYELRGGERYVRARVAQSENREAWTQAYFTGWKNPD